MNKLKRWAKRRVQVDEQTWQQIERLSIERDRKIGVHEYFD